jgi:hypothetical protein
MALKAGFAALIVLFSAHASVQAQDCGRDALAGIVSEASAQLTTINDAGKMRFQEKLQALKAKSGWSDAEFIAHATPFIKDDRIAAFDAENKALLARVPEIGAGTSVASLASVTPDLNDGRSGRCRMAGELRQLMSAVVENSRAKWSYMQGRLDAALGGAQVDQNSQ